MTISSVLSDIPRELRAPLLSEYRSIVRNYSESRWSPSELSGGHFCEIVYTILDGHAKGRYASRPTKPNDFVSACRRLEANTNVPRSFQILIPRMLPALYEVRNNRGVGHAGGDVDPNHMDATLVLSMANWVMAELVRVFYDTSIDEAQILVDGIAERQIPLIWERNKMRRVLDPNMSLRDQIMVLVASSAQKISMDDLMNWCDYENQTYFQGLLDALHKNRMLEVSDDHADIEILPPGSSYVSKLLDGRQTIA